MAQEQNMSTSGTMSIEDHSGHPGPKTYFKVAMTLAVITAIEVGIFYIEGLGHGILPILIILSGAKFALVVMFYMHLKYDDKLFTTFFVSGMTLSFLVVLSLLGLFKWFV